MNKNEKGVQQLTGRAGCLAMVLALLALALLFYALYAVIGAWCTLGEQAGAANEERALEVAWAIGRLLLAGAIFVIVTLLSGVLKYLREWRGGGK